MPERDELRRLAEAATPGPWSVHKSPYTGKFFVRDDGNGFVAGCECHPQDAAYIAAANPTMVLDLLNMADRAERAEGERDEAIPYWLDRVRTEAIRAERAEGERDEAQRAREGWKESAQDAAARAEKAEGLLREAVSELEGHCTDPIHNARDIRCDICEAAVPMKDSADYKRHDPGCILHRIAAALEAKPPRAVPAQGPPGARASGGRTMSERERLSDEQIREAAEFLRKLDRCETHRDLVSMVEGECLARGRERDAAIARAEKAEGLLQQLTTCRGRFEGRDAFCRYCANAAELAALEGQP